MLSLREYTPAAVCIGLVLATATAHARTHSELASFYSSGRVTASGEKFDKGALKAAHPSLPFGSIVRVVNKRNGKSVVVEINDRGPAKWTRRVVLRRAAWDFDAPVEVVSGYRSLSHNRAVYGNRRKAAGRYAGDGSQHIRCRAADIRIAGVSPARLHA